MNVHNEFNIQNNIINKALQQEHYKSNDQVVASSASAGHQEDARAKSKSKKVKSMGIQKPKRWSY